MNEATYALAGVLVGVLASGLVNFALQCRRFNHEKEMYRLQHQSKENVKCLLHEVLSHQSHIERSFATLSRRIGGYTDEQIRQFLHEVGAKRTFRKDGDEEWWYLSSREPERIERA